MRRRASRVAIFAAVVAAHLLVLHFLPDFHLPLEVSDREPSLPIAIILTGPRHSRTAISGARPPTRQRETAVAPSRRTKRTPGERKPESASGAILSARAIRTWIDWEKEAGEAVGHRTELAAQAARRASALSRWREHVMPGPAPPRPEFRWDYAATHRFQSTQGGLVININDRCSIVTNGLFVLPVCRIGKIPAYGDLFAHMDDPKEPGDSSVP